MSAFDLLKAHYEKNMGNIGATQGDRPPEGARALNPNNPREVVADDGGIAHVIERAGDV